MDEEEIRRRFNSGRIARMATVGRDGQPHVVPLVFAAEGDRIYSIVDAKPKSSSRLRRLADIGANPRVCLIVDHYDEDWATLWWARADGTARVVEAGAERDRAIELLWVKYRQYAESSTTIGPAIVVTVERWLGWAFI